MSAQTATKAARPDLECSVPLLPSRHIQPPNHNVVPCLPREDECSTRATSVIYSPWKVTANPYRLATRSDISCSYLSRETNTHVKNKNKIDQDDQSTSCCVTDRAEVNGRLSLR